MRVISLSVAAVLVAISIVVGFALWDVDRITVFKSDTAGCMCGPGYYYVDQDYIWEINPHHEQRSKAFRVFRNGSQLEYNHYDPEGKFEPMPNSLFGITDHGLSFGGEIEGHPVRVSSTEFARFMAFNEPVQKSEDDSE